MKHKILAFRVLLALALVVLFALPATVGAQDPDETNTTQPLSEEFSTTAKVAAVPTILFYRDSVVGDGVFDDALTDLDLMGNVYFTSSAGDFNNQLVRTEPWDCVIALQQNWRGTSTYAANLASYVTTGGRAIFADWTLNFSGQTALYNAFEVQGTGAINMSPITTDANPIWSGLPSSVSLYNPGWGRWSFGLASSTGVSTGTFPNDNAVVVVGNDGATAYNGFLSDTFLTHAEGVQMATNEIQEICFPNSPPTADPNGPYLGAAGSPIEFDGTGSSDPDGDPLTYAWDFGDSNTDSGATPSHTYAVAGIYDVCLTVNDGYVDSDQECTIAVVYDPDAGFVTGGGWIYSDPGAYDPDPELEGKANFGFVSKYKKGAETPTGNTEFQFHAADLNFHSSSYEWLVVTGSNYARFKGLGTINGEGEYKFMLWAGDDDPDTFRIKIWEENGDETVIYDNGMDQEIGGGSIVIHVKKK